MIRTFQLCAHVFVNKAGQTVSFKQPTLSLRSNRPQEILKYIYLYLSLSVDKAHM